MKSNYRLLTFTLLLVGGLSATAQDDRFTAKTINVEETTDGSNQVC
jgi:hypothetical protein